MSVRAHGYEFCKYIYYIDIIIYKKNVFTTIACRIIMYFRLFSVK